MSEVGGRLGCTRVIRGEVCDKPKLHSIHVGSGMEHEYRKPERKARREAMAAHSDKMQVHYDEERIPEVIAIQGAACEARVSDRVSVGPRYRCTDTAVDIHEVVRRSQAGGLIPALQYQTLAVCRPCHSWISNHSAGARALGFELRLRDIEAAS